MRQRKYPIQIWFLSDDLQQSAQWLANKHLIKTINGCMQVLVAARMYYVGIRTPKFYKHFFDVDHKAETLDKLFPLWPLRQKPPFMGYKSKVSKWCRMCKEHYDYIKHYLDILLQEYEFRFKKMHGLSKFLEWLECDAPALPIPEGHLSNIVIPWKCLDPQFRDKDICAGYRAQYKAVMKNDGIKPTDYKCRDIPEFLFNSNENSKWLE